MRTLDRGFLAANPADGTPAKFTFEAKATDDSGIPRNPDSTRPSVIITATGPTWLDLLTALDLVHGSDAEDLALWLLPEDADEATLTDTTAPFRDFTGSMGLGSDNEDAEQSTIELTIHAPCLVAGLRALNWVTRPQSLQSAAIAVCPETEDDEFDDEESVLVVR